MHAAEPLHVSRTFSEAVLDQLRIDIVGGEFQPLAKLPMKTLVARYKAGLSPVREALHRLVGEGFVVTVGQRGFTVPPLSLEDLEDLTALRAMVERTAILQSIAKGDDEWEAGIVAAFHRLKKEMGRFSSSDNAVIRSYDAIHRKFHCALFAASSPRLAGLQANLFDQAFRYRKSLHRQRLTATHVLGEHRTLMDAVLSRDPQRAAAAILGHLQLTPAATRHLLVADASAGAAKARR